MSSPQGHQNALVGAAAPRPPSGVMSATMYVTQQCNTNTPTGPSMWGRSGRIMAPTVTPVATSLPLQQIARTVPQTNSSPTCYADPATLLGTGSGGTAPLQVLASPQQQQQQAELHANFGEHLRAPPPLANLASESCNGKEKALIFQLRGLPFATTREDVEAFLRNVNYHRLDVGTLATGESSGNAFLELRDLRAAQQLGRLHNTIITVAADARVPPRERPRPRYVEVLNADAIRREQVLRIDARTPRSALLQQRRARTAAAAVPATNIASFIGASTEPPPPQGSLAEFAEGDVRCFAAPTVTLPSHSSALMPPAPSQRFMEWPYLGGSSSVSWSAYAPPPPQQPQSSLFLASSMPAPHFLGPQAAAMTTSSVPAMLHVQNVEESGLVRGTTLAPLPLYQLVTPLASRLQATSQQRVFARSNVSYFVVAAVSAPSSTLAEAQNTYCVAATSSTQAAASSNYYYLDGSSA
ncbi:hypothetical protein CUR178_02049 [Leishmania enriettii]|uniref:RRM domain-containing protein n=1 Tax=Leishmania enriettii TaxID=5663 RepID=A0A836GLI3_LEIEN|nr:hypothetical protein CUR178_02049 [Leishmania enriettii]